MTELRRSAAAPDRVCEAVREAASRRKRLRPRGAGSWWPDGGAPALDATVDALHLRVDAEDLVATAGAGVPLDQLAVSLAAHGVFLAVDPPGEPYRTLGGALAGGSPGPLAARFGPPRDQVLGMTLVTGNGTIVRTGGRVVKNVAGFDLAKVVTGSHGAFGVIRSVHLRLRSLPTEDLTAGWCGERSIIAATAAGLLAEGAVPAALEAVSPSLAAALGLQESWTLIIRALGTREGVGEELDWADELAQRHGAAATDGPDDVWGRWRRSLGSLPVLFRIGADPCTWPAAAELAAATLGATAAISVTVPRGTVRAGAHEVSPTAVGRLRSECASRGWPVTLERAGAPLREHCGVWGKLDPRTRELVARLRAVFDPNGVFSVPLFGA